MTFAAGILFGVAPVSESDRHPGSSKSKVLQIMAIVAQVLVQDGLPVRLYYVTLIAVDAEPYVLCM